MRPFILCLLTLAVAPFAQAQTANPDSYAGLQDAPLVVTPSLGAADFNALATPAQAFDSPAWSYLDTLPAAATSYPVDAALVAWNAPGFISASSTVAGWKTAALPLVGGPVAAFPTAPSVLGGLGSPNAVNTYLFRNTLTLTADQALNPNWTLSLFANDGAVVYVNGREVGRYNLPAGAVTPATFASAAGHTTAPGVFTFPLLGALRAGVNTVAVELHQATAASPEAALNVALYPVLAAESGFVPVKDAFGTNQPTTNFLTYETTLGNGGTPGLRVRMPNFSNNTTSVPASGAWRRTVRAYRAGNYTLSVRSLLNVAVTSNTATAVNYGESVLMVNGTRHGPGAGTSLLRYSRAAATTGTNDSGWILYTVTVPLVEGDNTIELGAYHTDNTCNITTNAYFDDFSISALPADFPSVLTNDTGTGLTAVLATGPTHGLLSLASSGAFAYLPASGYRGADSFTYQASSGGLNSAAATVSLTLTGVNTKPSAVADSYNATEDQTLTVNAALGVLANDSDPEADPLTAQLVTPPASGTLSLAPDGSFTYAPAGDFSGPVTFAYRASDGVLFSTPATVTVNVAGVNDAPSAADNSFFTNGSGPFTVAAPGVLGNDSDPDAGDTLAAVLVSTTAHGALTLNADGSLSYLSDVSFSGVDSFTYQARDTAGLLSPVRTVFIEINHQPVAQADSYAASEDTQLAVAAPGVLGNDSDADAGQFLSAFLVAPPAHGSVVLKSDGSFSYVSVTNYSGPDSFTYTASDGRESTAPVTVSLTVAAVDDAPLANDDSYEVRQAVTRVVGPFHGVLANDRDPEGKSLAASVVTAPLHGVLTLAANGSFTYVPAADYAGPDSFTYAASDGAVASVPATVSLRVKSHAETVVISEVMYHPSVVTAAEKTAGFTSPDQFEWFELHNPSAAAVDVSGWAVSKGVTFTFPAGASIPAGGYLVVAAYADAFQFRHPAVANLVGGWTGNLSNTSETIAVSDALGREMDSASYADEGSFATRVAITDSLGETGWEWSSPSDGFGRSLEVRNLMVSNKKGHNWAASLVDGGTPGAANGNSSSDLAPLLSDLSHSPAMPRTGQAVTVTVRAEDEADAPPVLSLHWRAATATPGAFATVAMRDDGVAPDTAAADGVFTGTIPAQSTDKTVIEFRVEAADAGGLIRSYPGTPDGTGSLALLQFDNETFTGNQPVYRVIATEIERAYFSGANYTHTSNAGQNITFLYTSGFGTEIRYNATLRYRGNSSRTISPMTCRVTLPSDAAWNGQTAFNLNSQFPHFQTLGNRLCVLAGLPGTPARLVQMRFNGANQANATSNQFGSYAHLDAIDGNYLKLAFPGDAAGNLYSKRRPGSTNTALAYRNDPVGTLYAADGFSKESNTDSSDYSDLNQLFFRLNQATLPAPYTSWWQYMDEVADLDQWMRYIAFNTFLNSQETNISNGMDDDYDIYRPLLDGRFKLVQHDLDTIFGGTTNLPLFQTNVSNGTGVLADNGVLPVLEKIFDDNKAVRRYYFHYLDLANGLLNPATFDAMVDNMFADSPLTVAARNSIKTNNTARRTYILSQIRQALTVTHNLTVTNGYPTASTATGLRLSGEIPAAYAASVTVNGVKVTQNNRAGTWESNAAAAAFPFSLTHGLNRLTVECRDEAGALVASSELEVWLTAAGTTASVAATGTTTWTAANSPYTVAANLAVPAEATLVLQPGVTVQFASGVSLNVAGIINAEGTATAPVKFVGSPGVVSWGGIQILNSPALNIFRHSVFSGASPGNAAAAAFGMLGQTGSSSLVEDCLFENCTRRRIRSQLSDLVVRRCTFAEHYPGATVPDASNNNISEHIWGSAKPVGGTFLLENNTFGKLKGHNDSVDVDGSHGGTVLVIRNNRFMGGGDDAMDLQGDSLIEGNLITNQIKDEYNLDPGNANGLSAGDNTNTGYHYVVLRNTFVNCEQVVFVKENTLCDFHHNTVVGTHLSSLYFDLAGQTAGPGKQLNASGNLFADCVGLIIDPVGSTPVVNVSKNFSTKSLGAYQGDTHLGTPLFTNATGLDFTLLPESPARAAGPLGRDCGFTCPSGVAVFGTPFTSASRQVAFALSVGGPGMVDYQWRLNGGEWSAATPVASPLNLSGLSGGVLLEVQGRDLTGVWSGTVSKSWTTSPAAWPVFLGEVLASNAAAVGGSADDYIELLNDSDAAVDVSGLRLSDSPVDGLTPAKFTLPAGSLLPARGHLLLTAAQLGFSLAETGETLSLYPPLAEGNAPLDSLTFGWQLPALALARRPGDNAWTLAAPTPGTAFTVPFQLVSASTAGLKINEWLAGSDVLLNDDFVELHNPAASPVLLAGWTLSDLPYADPARRPAFPAFTYLAAAGFRDFRADGNSTAGTDHLVFKLDAGNGQLQLRNSAQTLVDSVSYNPQQPDRSQGRSPDGGATFAYFTTPTPGFSNTASATENALLGSLRITEIHFHPAGDGDLEFIELRNTGATPLDLSGVSFTSGLSFTFAPGATLAAGATTLVVRDPVKFAAFYGPGKPVAGAFTGRLDNLGETIRLETSRGLAIHDFRYEPFWQPAADGLGASLEIISDTAAASTWALASSWRASLLVGGSPGGTATFVASAGSDAAVSLPSAGVLRATLTASAPVSGLAFTWTQLAGPAATLSTPGLPSTYVTFPAAGTYTFRVTATAGSQSSADDIVLTAAPPASPLETWRGSTFGADATNPAIAGDNADPDHDGVSNLLEYALGTSPLASSAPTQPVASANGQITFAYRRNLSASGLGFALESADAPGSAYTPVSGVTTTVLGNDGATEEVRLTFPDNGQPHRFFRLRVTVP